MNPKIVRETPPVDTGRNILVSQSLAAALSVTTETDWESLFYQFRLNLQSRIVGSDERELLKLQGKIEHIGELETFFCKLVSSKTQIAAFR